MRSPFQNKMLKMAKSIEDLAKMAATQMESSRAIAMQQIEKIKDPAQKERLKKAFDEGVEAAKNGDWEKAQVVINQLQKYADNNEPT